MSQAILWVLCVEVESLKIVLYRSGQVALWMVCLGGMRLAKHKPGGQ